MSEKKSKRMSAMYTYNARDSEDPLIKVLERIAHREPSKYLHLTGEVNKMRLTHDFLVIAARKLLTDYGDMEGLRLLDDHEKRTSMQAALREGKPLPETPTAQPQAAAPALTLAPAPAPTQPSATPPTETSPMPTAPVVPIPKPPEQKKKRIVSLVINESGHSRIKRE